ncbi:udp-glycosyltransferase 73d1 [Quercus suber]|uniref:Udp-glycosyltransferase 73d1 n=1 Tax=Quercus suber TaxID=58331 RepID=A0AAW0KJF4_QUESU
MLQKPLEEWLEESESLPNCIISDLCPPWTTEIALKFKFPRLIFQTTSCFSLLCSHNITSSNVLEGVTSNSEPFLNIWCTGPLSLCNKISDKLENGNDTSNDTSVIYVCFGSLCQMIASQLVELALGLEASNYPFIWVIKKGDYSKEFENWLVEENFEERTKERGLIIRGWAPQVQILSHSAIRGFLTHCGSNSTLEAVITGVPVITWPMISEQFYNEKLLVQVLRIGVRVGINVSTDNEEEKDKVLVKSEDVKKAIEQLMEEEREERRERARKLRGITKKAVEEGGSSYFNEELLIQHIRGQSRVLIILSIWRRNVIFLKIGMDNAKNVIQISIEVF